MEQLLTVTIITLCAGLTMPLGAIIAQVEHIRPAWLENEFRHAIIAMGAGALLSAIALVLVPEGIANLTPLQASLAFITGGLGFMLLDIFLVKIATPASQLAAMLADFIPESIALGAAFALGNPQAFLLAGLIALQNLPEGFNAYREISALKPNRTVKVIIAFTLLSTLGAISGISGYLFLYEYPKTLSVIMLFASGGILYSIFQDIAPQVKLKNHWFPPMGAVIGFMLGILGQMLII